MVHLFSLSGTMGWILGVSQRPSPVFGAVFCRRCQWIPAHPSLPPVFPNTRASLCSSPASPWMFWGLLEVVGCADLSELTVPPQSHACCSAGLWIRALDGAGGNPEEGGNVCLIPAWCKVQSEQIAKLHGQSRARFSLWFADNMCGAGSQRGAGEKKTVRFICLCGLFLI